MKAICMVVDDVTKPWEVNGDKGISRKLTLVDQDPEHRLIPAFLCKIPVKSELTGDGNQGASLKDSIIEIAFNDIEQNDYNKRLTLKGDVLAIKGTMKMVPFKPEPAPKAA